MVDRSLAANETEAGSTTAAATTVGYGNPWGCEIRADHAHNATGRTTPSGHISAHARSFCQTGRSYSFLRHRQRLERSSYRGWVNIVSTKTYTCPDDVRSLRVICTNNGTRNLMNSQILWDCPTGSLYHYRHSADGVLKITSTGQQYIDYS